LKTQLPVDDTLRIQRYTFRLGFTNVKLKFFLTPLSKIDLLVDTTVGHSMLSLIDTLSGHHQVPLHPKDKEKTAFITDQALYCYTIMPFGLKNSGAKYQQLVNTIFKRLIGNMSMA